jgi:dCTP deaminase
LEYFRIPRDVMVLCQGKSTYARCGVIVNVTPLEPEWEGFITLAIVNASPVSAKVYSNEGIAQLVFIRSEGECETSYADRKGKYQAQKRIGLSQV